MNEPEIAFLVQDKFRLARVAVVKRGPAMAMLKQDARKFGAALEPVQGYSAPVYVPQSVHAANLYPTLEEALAAILPHAVRQQAVHSSVAAQWQDCINRIGKHLENTVQHKRNSEEVADAT